MPRRRSRRAASAAAASASRRAISSFFSATSARRRSNSASSPRGLGGADGLAGGVALGQRGFGGGDAGAAGLVEGEDLAARRAAGRGGRGRRRRRAARRGSGGCRAYGPQKRAGRVMPDKGRKGKDFRDPESVWNPYGIHMGVLRLLAGGGAPGPQHVVHAVVAGRLPGDPDRGLQGGSRERRVVRYAADDLEALAGPAKKTEFSPGTSPPRADEKPMLPRLRLPVSPCRAVAITSFRVTPRPSAANSASSSAVPEGASILSQG